MASITEAQDHIAKYISGQLSYSDFERWLVRALWAAPADDELLPGIHVAIAEYENDHISEQSLKNDLSALLQNLSFDFLVTAEKKTPTLFELVTASEIVVHTQSGPVRERTVRLYPTSPRTSKSLHHPTPA